MIVLIGIIVFHLLAILRAKLSIREGVPYATIFFLTIMMVTFVVAMMYNMESPKE